MKTFKELNNSDTFKYNNIMWTKIPAEKISCCTTINAVSIDGKHKTYVQPNINVEVEENPQWWT